MQDLGLEPIDLLYLHDADSAKNLSALDDHVLRFFQTAAPRRPDLEIAVDYTAASGSDITFFELGSLLSELRTLVLAARPLRGERRRAAERRIEDAERHGGGRRRPHHRRQGDVRRGALGPATPTVIAFFDPLIDFEDVAVGMSNLAAIVAAIDARSALFVEHMSTLSLFGMTGAGAGFVHERKRQIHAAHPQPRAGVPETLGGFRGALSDAHRHDLPASRHEHEQIAVLQRAETLISTSFTTTFIDVADLQGIVEGKKTLFDAKRDELHDFLRRRS